MFQKYHIFLQHSLKWDIEVETKKIFLKTKIMIALPQFREAYTESQN